ncbi:co-chaperone GroES [bacterium]|nr:co-chaperone GroES [bacterium]
MNLKPLDERVIVKPLEEDEEKKVGSIIIPDTAKERPQMGEVVAVGDDVPKKEGGKLLSQVLKAGDRVIYSKYGGTEIEQEGQKYLILSRGDILAKIG